MVTNRLGDRHHPLSVLRRTVAARHAQALPNAGGWCACRTWNVPYESESEFPVDASLKAVRELVELLGYQKAADRVKAPDCVGSYMWYDAIDYRSYVGVEFSIYKAKNSPIVVSTRSRAGRSHWDLCTKTER